MRAVLLAPDGTWIAALPIPVEEKGKPDKDLGFRIYSGLTGSMPTPESAAAVKEQEIESDIRLEGPSISADSRYLAAAVGEDRLRVWEFPSLSQMAWVRGHQRSVRGTAFHPHNSGIVASTSWDGTTRFWDIPTRKEILILPTGGDELLLLPQRGEVLLRTWDRNAIRSAPLSTESALRVLLLPPNTPFGLLSGMSFNRDGTLLAAAGDAGVIVWEMKSGRPFVAQLPGEPQDWRDVVFMPDNSAILCSGRKGLMRRSLSTDAGRGLAFGAAETVLSGYCGDLQWLDARLAISGRRGKDGGNCVELLHSDGTASELPAKQAPDLLAAPPSGRWLAATVYPNGGGYLWDMKASPPSAVEASSTTRCAFGFSPDGSVLLTGTDSLVTITTTAAPQRQIAPPLPRKNSEFIPARSASIAAAGLVAIATGPYEITLCDAKTLLPLLALDSPLMPFDCLLEFSPDGRILAAAGGVSRVILWDIAYIKSELAALGLGW
jgi:WD40 repeat protein